MRWEYKIFKPVQTGSFGQQLEGCIIGLDNFLKFLGNGRIILRLDIFLSFDGIAAFSERKNTIEKSGIFQKQQILLAEIIPLPPVPYEVVFRLSFCENLPEPVKIKTGKSGGLSQLEITNPSEQILITSCPVFSENFKKASSECFLKTNKALADAGLGFNDVVRQWNYIGGILNYSGERQNYQEFNDIRSDYYSHSLFTNGYPAATGIGMEFPGIIIQVIAFRFLGEGHISAINNPWQIPAHQYSENVLPGKAAERLRKSAPKFERAKLVASSEGGWLFISGTAAIKGEKQAPDESLTKQLLTTLELISNLVSGENLKKHGLDPDSFQLLPVTYTAYVKNREGLEKITHMCQAYFREVPGLAVVADVCRDSLLVEIECEFIIMPS